MELQTACDAVLRAHHNLTSIPDRLLDVSSADGSTPRQDAQEFLRLAAVGIRSIETDAAQVDVDELRAMRRYADKWDPDDDLRLDP